MDSTASRAAPQPLPRDFRRWPRLFHKLADQAALRAVILAAPLDDNGAAPWAWPDDYLIAAMLRLPCGREPALFAQWRRAGHIYGVAIAGDRDHVAAWWRLAGGVGRVIGSLPAVRDAADADVLDEPDAARRFALALAAVARAARDGQADQFAECFAACRAEDLVAPPQAAMRHGATLAEIAEAVRAAGGQAVRCVIVADLARVSAEFLAAATPPPVAQAAPVAPAAPRAGPVLRREGDVWYIAAFGEEARVKHCRGLEYIAALIDAAGQPRHVAELLGREPRAETGGVQLVADQAALAEYRRELREHDAEIARAEASGDATGAALLAKEREQLLARLRADLGRGGRARQFVSTYAQQLAAVRKALSRAYDALRAAGLSKTAEHFAAFIACHGGSYTYLPSPPVPWVR